MLSPWIILLMILGYFGVLIIIGFATGKKAGNREFFKAANQSPWYVVAFGMIGASLSGVTFISVPGSVAEDQFTYMQVVFGYLPGYLVIATILMPLYYRLNLTSIYGYLEGRFGVRSYKTGASFFLLSRTIGSASRLYLVAIVLQIAVFDHWNIPFFVTVTTTILLIWLYTFKGGIKTIIWTDTLQTLFMLIAVGVSIYMIGQKLGISPGAIIETVRESEFSRMFIFDDINRPDHFIKQFLSGAFIAIVMTGLDQDMMQKNLSCRNLREAQKNMFTFSAVLIFVNLMFLSLGALLYLYTDSIGMAYPDKPDDLYPTLAMGGHFGLLVAVCFIVGLIAAAYSSADSALTALTTSFCVDILDLEKKPETHRESIRKRVHISISAAMAVVIILFEILNDTSVLMAVFTIAGYTYGPLLGLYSFGLFTRLNVKDRWVPLVCILAPLLSYGIYYFSPILFNGYKIGFELLIINGFLTFTGLLIISKRQSVQNKSAGYLSS